MKRDRFQTAGRIAESMAHEAPKDPREEMRPLTPAEVRAREYEQVIGRREFGRRMADDRIFLALARMLWPEDYGRPSTFDREILLVMDDGDIQSFAYNVDHAARLIRYRDNFRARLS